MSGMHITIYCPDRHILYDGSMPDRTGVGGGVTMRIRVAAALARRGHRVSLICNCGRESVHGGVRYIPLDTVRGIECDVLVMHSSGWALDLTSLLAVSLEVKIRVVALSGPDLPGGTAQLNPDAIYACSNFVGREVCRRAAIPGEKLFVSYHGVNRWNRAGGVFGPRRNPHRLIYSSHPSKGLNAAFAITRMLHARDARFTLHWFGGNRLWGGEEDAPSEEPGMHYGGLVGQRHLAGEYKRSGFSLQLQTRHEPFGISVIEAMAAGCVVVASPVGSLCELIRNGETGFLIEGDPSQPQTVKRAADLLWNLCGSPELMENVRRRALPTVLDWDMVAEVWEAHFGWLLNRRRPTSDAAWARCVECGASSLALADGYHCTVCGYFGPGCRLLESMS